MKVLIFEGRARQCLPFIRAFKKLGCEVDALCSSKLDISYACRFVDNKILGICNNLDEEATINQVRQLLETNNYDLVVPMTDFAAKILSKNKEEFSKYCYVMSNDLEVFDIAHDKNKTMKICMDNNIPCPKTYLNLSSIEEIETYPVVVKPISGYGAIGFKVVNSKEELSNIDLTDCVVQEYIPQTDLQYECAMFVDNNNEVKASLVFSKNRWFPVNGGSSTLNITVHRKDIVESCSKLLKSINWRGPADIDVIQDPRDNTAKIMEINPRVSGSVKICFEAGVDQAKQMLELVQNKEVTNYNNYTIGNRLRCFQTDVLWFIKSKDRFNTNPSWFSNKNTKDQIFYLDDPLPFITFSIGGLFKYKDEMNKRK